MTRLTKLWDRIWKNEGHQEIETPTDIRQEFSLFYRHHHIGTLALDNGLWSYQYSEYYKNKRPIQPLPDFAEVEKVYLFEELHPFFMQRIPSIQQPEVKATIERENINAQNEIDLLKRFGRLTVANPFILNPV